MSDTSHFSVFSDLHSLKIKYSNQLHISITNNINELCLLSHEKENLGRGKGVICVTVCV